MTSRCVFYILLCPISGLEGYKPRGPGTSKRLALRVLIRDRERRTTELAKCAVVLYWDTYSNNIRLVIGVGRSRPPPVRGVGLLLAGPGNDDHGCAHSTLGRGCCLLDQMRGKPNSG